MRLLLNMAQPVAWEVSRGDMMVWCAALINFCVQLLHDQTDQININSVQ